MCRKGGQQTPIAVNNLQILIAISAVVLAAFALRRVLTPRCPRCSARKWDRKLCRPLLFCRACSTRCDTNLRVYN
jgi:hypothetical protein